MTRPPGMKKLVPATRSRIRSRHAGRRTAKASRLMHEVMNHAQVHSGIRAKVIPFGAQIKRGGDEVERSKKRSNAKYKNGKSPKRLTQTFAGAGVGADGAQRSIGRPTGKRRPIGHEESRDQNAKGHERGPERHHVETREGHVFGADLNRQEIISEGSERSVGKNKEDHQRPVHGEQGQVVLRRHDAAREHRTLTAIASPGWARWARPGGGASATTGPCRSAPQRVRGRSTACR